MPRLRLFPVRSGRIIASVGKNGWLAMRALQRLARSPSSCSASPKPSQPSSACRQLSMSHVPSDRGLLCSERPAAPLAIGTLWLLCFPTGRVSQERRTFPLSSPRDAQRDASWEEARKQETEHVEINEAAGEGEKISSLQNTISYGMLWYERESCESAKEEGKSDGASHQTQMVTRRAGSS